MRKQIDHITKYLLAVLMAILVLDVIWQVFTRYVLQSPSTFTDELSRFLLIWVSMIGAAYASGQDMHLAIDLLSTKLSDTQNRTVDIIINSVIIVFVLGVMVVGGCMLSYLTYSQPSPSLGISMGLVYSIVPISGLLIFYYKMCDLMSLMKYSPENEGK